MMTACASVALMFGGAVHHHLTTLPLTGAIAGAAYWVSMSAGPVVIPCASAVLIVIVLRYGTSLRRNMLRDGFVVFFALALTAAAGAYFNERFAKPAFEKPRPHIVMLSAKPVERPSLQMTSQQFYALSPEHTRTAHLMAILTADEFNGEAMNDGIRAHWAEECDYAFPSNRAFVAMLVATFFLATAFRFLRAVRYWFLVIPIWAVAVCYSRVILRVHNPADVLAGGIEGCVVGLLVFLLVQRYLSGRTRPFLHRAIDP